MNKGILFSLCICLGVTLFVIQADNLPEMPVQNEPIHEPVVEKSPENSPEIKENPVMLSSFLAELVVPQKAPQPIIEAAVQEPELPQPEVAEPLPAIKEPSVEDVPVCHVSYDGTLMYDCMQCRQVAPEENPEQEVPQGVQQESVVIEVTPEESELIESEELQLPVIHEEPQEVQPAVIEEAIQPPIELQQLDLDTLRIEEPVVEPLIKVVIEPVNVPAYEPAIEVAVQAKKRTPLEEKLLSAARNGRSTTVKYALKNPHVNVNITDDEGRTPLMLGALSGHAGTVKVILHNNPDLTAMSTTQETALSIAREQGAHKIEKLLLKAGAQE